MTESGNEIPETPEAPRDELEAVLQAVSDQTGEIKTLSNAVQAFNDRWKWARIVVAVSLAAAVISLGVAVVSLRTANDIVTNRTNSRIVACKDANTFGSFHNALLDATEGIIRAVAVPQPNRTPEQQAEAEKFAADNLAALEKTRVTMRDCSASAVNKYYDHATP